MSASCLLSVCVLLALPPVRGGDEVEIVRLPDGARRPQAVVDARGALHALYVLVPGRGGHGGAGHLFYAAREPGAPAWAAPIRVTDRPASVITPQVAVGADGRVHVCWASLAPQAFWYTRLDPKRGAFEPVRDVSKSGTVGLEYGPVLVVDGEDHVHLIWHEGDFAREERRGVFARSSKNGGRTFGRARQVSPKDAGVCACCTLAAAVDGDGALYVAFRAAKDRVHRDMLLLRSDDRGRRFTAATIDEWEFNACPTSLTGIARGPGGRLTVLWETKDQDVSFAPVDDLQKVHKVPGPALQRRPQIAVNGQGETLITYYTREPGQPRMVMRWQVFDRDGAPTEEKGRVPQQGRWFGAAVVALADGRFALVF